MHAQNYICTVIFALLFRSKEIGKIVGNKFALLFRSKEIGKIVGNVKNKRLMYCMIMSLKRVTGVSK